MLRFTSAAKFRQSSIFFAKVVPYLLADIGEGILEVEVKEWFVKPGDTVKQFQPICEVQSDKATTPISSRYDGIIRKLYVEQNSIAKVGSPIVDIETDAVIAPSSGAKAKPVEKTPAAAKQQQQEQVPASSSTTTTTAASAIGGVKVVRSLLVKFGEGLFENCSEVQVTQWLVKPGDAIKQDQLLCQVESEKFAGDIRAPCDGIIRKCYVEQTGVAKKGAPIADIETTVPNNNNNNAATHGGKALCPPSVRRIAEENKIDLANVPSTGKGGRVITKEDILKFIQDNGAFSVFVTESQSGPQQQRKQQQQQPPSSSTGRRLTGAAPEDKAVKITGVKRIMVQSMTKANNIPAFGNCDEIEISNLMRARKLLAAGFAKRHAAELRDPKKAPLKLSFMPFFLKAASLSLSRYPDINAHTNDDCTVLTLKGSHNLGFAMDTPQGLIVPVIRDVQDKSLFDIAVDLHDLIGRTAAGAVTAADLQGATFTLSNIGSIGATYTVPVINPPQVAIGALGRGRVLPRFDEQSGIYKANIVEVSWAADHRVVDGATMVRFGNSFKEFLENPELMLGYLR